MAGLYDLEETLGEGHYAVVKSARHVFTGEKVAVKVIDKMKLDAATQVGSTNQIFLLWKIKNPGRTFKSDNHHQKLFYTNTTFITYNIRVISTTVRIALMILLQLQMLQEVHLMKLVQHPHVVRLYEVIDTATKLYLILELADGGDMYDYIMKHDEGLAEETARKYFRQVCPV